MSGAPTNLHHSPELSRIVVLMLHGPLEMRDVRKSSGRKWFSLADAHATSVRDCYIDQLVRRRLILVRRGHATLSQTGEQVARAIARTCRRCGCTDTQSCAAGCCWAQADLCSACVVSTDDLKENAA